MLAALAVALTGGAPERALDETSENAEAHPHEGPDAKAATQRSQGGARSASGPAASAPGAAASTNAPPTLEAARAAGPAAPNLADPPSGGGVRALALDASEMRKALAAVPALASVAAEFVPFSDSDADAALRRGGRSRDGIALWTFQPAAFGWTPRAGREFWVLSGRAGASALIAVLEPAGQRFEHVASLVLHEPEVTVAVGYSDQHRDQLVWSTCYGCAGEGGTIRSREDGRIEFAYR
jgi:hypothetical protein